LIKKSIIQSFRDEEQLETNRKREIAETSFDIVK